MHTICRYCRVGERFVDQESLCWVIQQQNMIRMKVHVLSDSTLCVGVSNSGPSNNWVTKLEDVCNEHGFVEISIWQPEKCNSFGTGAGTIDFKKRIQIYLHGLDPQSFEERIVLLSMFNDVDETPKKEMQSDVCTTPKKWQSFRWSSRRDTGNFWYQHPETLGGTEIPTSLKERWRPLHWRWWSYLAFMLHTQYVLRQYHHRLDNSKNDEKLPFSMHIWQQGDSHQDHIGRRPP